MFKKTAALMVLAALLISPGLVFALGLGSIQIHSALNQPIDAEIELIGFNADEIDEVSVSLASQKIFERFDVPRPYILTRLKFTPTVSAGRPIIKISSRQAIPEPFLILLLDVRWSQGKLLREYTLLLDPPIFSDQVRATIEAAKAAMQPPQAPVAETEPPMQSAITTPAPETASADFTLKEMPQPPASAKKNQTAITVNRGDTLWGIAASHAGRYGVSINQMMLAIQAANPHAFMQGNMNNLKAGAVLRIPADGLERYSAREAVAEVQRQWQMWRQDRQMASVDVQDSASPAGQPIDQTPVSDVQVSDAQAPAEKADTSRLSILGDSEGDSEISQTQSGADAQATLQDLRKQVNLLRESAESKGQENVELKDRIGSLESMIKKQENIISLQSEQLAQLQNTLSENNAAGAELEMVAQEELALAENEAQLEAQLNAEANTPGAIPKAYVAPLPDFSEPVAEELLNAQSAPETPVAETEDAAEYSQQPAVEESAVQLSAMNVLRDQGRNMLYAGAVLLVALIAWVIFRRRHSAGPALAVAPGGRGGLENSAQNDFEKPAFFDEPDDEPARAPDKEAVTAAAGSVDQQPEQELDDMQAMNVKTAASPREAAPQQNDNQNDSDDILDEVDVYISYGLYQQAEELLKQGLGKQPANQRYQLKLAEIYYNNKRADEFAQQAEAIAENIDKRSAEWSRMVSMGTALIPGHALFAGADPSAASGAQEASQNDSGKDTGAEDMDISEAAEQTPAENDQPEEFSTAELDLSGLDMAKAQTQADTPESGDEENDEDGMFMDFDQDALEGELKASAPKEPDPANTENAESQSQAGDAQRLADELEDGFGDGSETAMFDFDSSLFDVKSDADQNSVGEDTISFEDVQQNPTVELETLNFDSDGIDLGKIEEDTLSAMQTSEINKSNLEAIDDLDQDLTASETGTLETSKLTGDDATEKFDLSNNTDSSAAGSGEFGNDTDLETPSIVEEVGTKLDLARAFVDMGDEDAAREALTEVIERGDVAQIQEAKELLDKLN